VAAKYRVEITRTAESDVEEIWTHIGADSIEHATKFVLQLKIQTRFFAGTSGGLFEITFDRE